MWAKPLFAVMDDPAADRRQRRMGEGTAKTYCRGRKGVDISYDPAPLKLEFLGCIWGGDSVDKNRSKFFFLDFNKYCCF
jgi:hypothetical protein